MHRWEGRVRTGFIGPTRELGTGLINSLYRTHRPGPGVPKSSVAFGGDVQGVADLQLSIKALNFSCKAAVI